MARKRARVEMQDTEQHSDHDNASARTPKRLRSGAVNHLSTELDSPSKKSTRIRSSAAEQLDLEAGDAEPSFVTPKHQRQKIKLAFSTPTGFQPVPGNAPDDGETITVVRNADRSARRNSTRKLIERTVAGELSGDDEFDETNLEREICDDEEEEDESERDGGVDDTTRVEDAAPTPSKRGRGRPKGSKRKRTPTPPPNMAPHENYFFDNRPSMAKSSSNNLSSMSLLSHSTYHDAISSYKDTHDSHIDELHRACIPEFPNWEFELSEGYSVCLYGYGSKRRLLSMFASHLHSTVSEDGTSPTIIIINGHHPSLTIRTVLNTIARTVLPPSQTLPTNPSLLLPQITKHLNSNPLPIYLLIAGIHTKPLSTGYSATLLSTLASHPSIHLLCTADNPFFPLQHTLFIRDNYNLLYHNTTTFLPYDSASSNTISELGGVVDSVLDLMGRRTADATSREGVRWVLKSLPENARGLYKILVEEILAGAGLEGHRGEDSGSESDGARVRTRRNAHLPGIEARVLYHKAVEEFLCSSEMSFRGLLKEFVDHRMVTITGAGLGGGEILGVDMAKEELEGVLEDIAEGV